jgi:hypothetical protein
MAAPDDFVQRADEFARRRGLVVRESLGYGIHGSVFTAERHLVLAPDDVMSAVKVYRRQADYARERHV